MLVTQLARDVAAVLVCRVSAEFSQGQRQESSISSQDSPTVSHPPQSALEGPRPSDGP